MLAGLLVALAVGLCVADADPRRAGAGSAELPAADVLVASQRGEAVAVARTLRVPGPCAASSRPNARLTATDLTGATAWHTPTQHRHVPLYTLLRVYRL